VAVLVRLLLLAAVLCALLLSGGRPPLPAVPPAAGQEGEEAPLEPALPQNLPDPSIVRAPDGFYLTGTSGSWAPIFPVFFSRDLRSWEQVGSVLGQAPRWARGHFWAPEIVADAGRYVVLYSASRRGGKACIAAATARHPAGPWRDRGRVLCRGGGAIDPTLVRDERGGRWLVYKAMGLGRGLLARRMSGLRAVGRPVELLRPSEGWEGPVTEGPELVRRGDEWFLLYSGGGCCRIPCTYGVGVARAPSLLGPWRKHPDGPLLRGGRGWRCTGHGSVVDAGGEGLVLAHHGYAVGDLEQRRRRVLLSRVTWGEDGWPELDLGLAPALVPEAVQPPPAPGFSDSFDAPALAQGWEWLFNRRPSARVEAGTLRLGCSIGATRPVLLARQVVEDAFTVEGALLPPPPADPALVDPSGAAVGLAVHAPDGTVRGVEVAGPATGGGALAGPPEVAPTEVRVFSVGRRGAKATGAPLPLPPGATVRLRMTVGGGVLQAAVSTDGVTWTPLDAGPAAAGQAPTRAGASCRGRGAGRFAWILTRRPG